MDWQEFDLAGKLSTAISRFPFYGELQSFKTKKVVPKKLPFS